MIFKPQLEPPMDSFVSLRETFSAPMGFLAVLLGPLEIFCVPPLEPMSVLVAVILVPRVTVFERRG